MNVAALRQAQLDLNVELEKIGQHKLQSSGGTESPAVSSFDIGKALAALVQILTLIGPVIQPFLKPTPAPTPAPGHPPVG